MSVTKIIRPFEPEEKDLLQQNKSQLILNRISSTSFFLKKGSVPSLSVDILKQPTPFRTENWSGWKPKFEQSMTLEFLVNQDLDNWQEIYSWITEMAPPDNFNQYVKGLEKLGHNSQEQGLKKSDGRLLVFNSLNRANYEFVFEDMFPINLGRLDFLMSSNDIMSCQVTFAYSKYSLEKINIMQ